MTVPRYKPATRKGSLQRKLRPAPGNVLAIRTVFGKRFSPGEIRVLETVIERKALATAGLMEPKKWELERENLLKRLEKGYGLSEAELKFLREQLSR